MAKLKVFRTPIGFHDAYIAAPSQKAALEAWGAEADLFARGVAERVDDPALSEAPLAHPGEVIKVSRGSASDHFKLVGASRARSRKNQPKTIDRPPPVSQPIASPRKKRPRPRPSRAALDRAESALAGIDEELERALEEISAQERALKEKRQALRTAHDARRDKLETALGKARTAYQQKIELWASE